MAAIGQTVAGLSHAIKNIAGGLKGGAFVLEKGIDLNKKKYLMQGWEMIKGNVSKITNLSMDLLNYAKTTEITFQTCHPNQPAQEVFELMKLRAHEAGIDFTCELGSDLGEINFDPELIHRCLLNLVSNALDACSVDFPGNTKKMVSIVTASADGWGVEYQVIDSCCGMDPQTQEKIFQSFFTTKGAQGTGIGLMITKKIVDEHNGTIEFESRKGSGSRFILRLPENPKSDTPDA
jgi:signal transduction histidine kinase